MALSVQSKGSSTRIPEENQSSDSCAITSDSRRSPGVLPPLQPGHSSLSTIFPKACHLLEAPEVRQGEGRGNPWQAEGNCLNRQICGVVDLVCLCFAGGGRSEG